MRRCKREDKSESQIKDNDRISHITGPFVKFVILIRSLRLLINYGKITVSNQYFAKVLILSCVCVWVEGF